jgi:transketolase N-terminal domain/subunit
MSDGELNEGSVFESAQFIAHHNLYNIKILIDNNKIQSFGRTKEILNINYKKVFAIKIQKAWRKYIIHGARIRNDLVLHGLAEYFYHPSRISFDI